MTTPPAPVDPSGRPRGLEPAQLVLAVLLVTEVMVFSAIGTNFFTIGNAFEILRLSTVVGLLAVALTPVIVGGGIDLSVGSLMGLSAVAFGWLLVAARLPVGAAAALTLALGAAAGGLNGLLITRLNIPPLIVTLGSLSLFRGLAVGLTGGTRNFTGFSEDFLFLGQGHFFGVIPAQVPLFVAVVAAYWVLLHRGTAGRGLVAIGFSPEGTRYAGLPVARLTGLVYMLSGLVSSLAAIIYVAYVGQAKADAGTGYELLAITAVVLGGTSIFGGRGSIAGTLLGLFAIAVLQNGLRLSSLPGWLFGSPTSIYLPGELAGILAGILLLVAIGLDRRAGPASAPAPIHEEEFNVKNAQVAVICAVILAAALIVAGSNVYLARSLRGQPAGAGARMGAGGGAAGIPDAPGDAARAPAPGPEEARGVTVAMMPKSKGNAYFIAVQQGAAEAAGELGVELIYDGPTDPDPAEQNRIVDTWITLGVKVIAVAVENREGIASVLRKARAKGIKVLTFDADTLPDARDFFVNQATPQGIGQALMDNAARVMGGKGKFAIITASLTAANMIEWQDQIKARLREKYPEIELTTIRPCDDLQAKAFEETRTILNSDPNVELIMAICSPAVPGAAEAVKQSGRDDVKVIGLGLPNDNKDYVKAGITDCIVLWNTVDLGYLTVHAARALATGALKPGDTEIRAGRLGTLAIEKDNILLGKPFIFTKDNIDRFDF